MSFNWKAIHSYEDSEVALYRLLGEMLRRKATLDDLDQIRAFLINATGLNSEGWLSLGEALHRSTTGSPVGYDIWLAWLETFDDVDVDIDRLGNVWAGFSDDLSEASDVADFDPDVDVLPTPEPVRPSSPDLPEIHPPPAAETIENEVFSIGDDDDTDATSIIPSQPVLRKASTSNTGVLGESPTQLMRLVPQGPFEVRIFGAEHHHVDEYTVLTLIKRGLFLGAEMRFGDRWLPSWQHPAFERISARLRSEAERILTRDIEDDGDPPTDQLGP